MTLIIKEVGQEITSATSSERIQTAREQTIGPRTGTHDEVESELRGRNKHLDSPGSRE